MDFQEYREKFYVKPAPNPRFKMSGLFGYTIYVEDFQNAQKFYEDVFGSPAYIEGEFTLGWQLGAAWFTLFQAKAGSPTNIEIQILLESPAEVDRLYAVFVAAGALGSEPSDELMYEPLRFAAISDPFGMQFTLVARQAE